ncbi:MAG TPA: bifunctional phosphoribosyl-AMP cyclohydrolase/phosphoribosyl-ATP diphosphatase [Eubacteriaceae bacterium]|nr:bifunctional phosphoribosyl-AMP cyclohydrolase/phosphoribosyl-ATP diphosphatase [Eubacteriaceae bacterium]
MNVKDLKFDEKGLIPAVIQDATTLKVLMVGYMNEESIHKTIETNKTWFYSRSRQKLWNKGETSGNFQEVVSMDYDCDEDTLLVKVHPKGPSCHTGEDSCFYRNLYERTKQKVNKNMLFDLYRLVQDRKNNPKEGSYTNYLFEKGVDKILKKVGEESAETIIAAKNNDPRELTCETSDLFYHIIVLLVNQGVSLEEILAELEKRHQ